MKRPLINGQSVRNHPLVQASVLPDWSSLKVWKWPTDQTQDRAQLPSSRRVGSPQIDLLVVILEKSSTRKGWWLQGHLHHWTPVDYTTASQHENMKTGHFELGHCRCFSSDILISLRSWEKVHLDPERRVPSRRRLLRIGFWREILLGPGFRESITQLWFQ